MKDVYNTFPDQAASYKGRLLMAQRIEPLDKGQKDKNGEIAPFRKKLKKKLSPMQEPRVRSYKLKVLVVTGSECPKFIDLGNVGKAQKLLVRVVCHKVELLTKKVENRSGVCEWYELLESEDLALPVDVTQVPDIIVQLCQVHLKSSRSP
jgi:hypothetical protein